MLVNTIINPNERERMAILRILGACGEAAGSNVIARRLKEEFGIELSERAVRYHLKQLDDQGLSHTVSRRSGRAITKAGLDELDNAMVSEKVGIVIDKIEMLAYQNTFDPERLTGMIPVNISLFLKEEFNAALKAMAPALRAGICVSDWVGVAREGERLGPLTVPEGKVGLATVCSIVVNGTLLKAGIPMDSRFGGTLQYRFYQPWRFTDLIYYSGSSLDPSEIFIASRMTSVTDAVRCGAGKILANFREVPALSLPLVNDIIQRLKVAGIKGILAMGEAGKTVCQMPVGAGKAGMVLAGGLNPVAMAAEGGVKVHSHAMSGIMDYQEMDSFWELFKYELRA